MTPLNRYAVERRDRLNLVTADEWQKAMTGFADRARYDAANLAAHNWDVTLVGDRLLVTSAWSGGAWWNKAGEPTAITDAEFDSFYPVSTDSYPRASRGHDGKKRQTAFNEKAIT